MLRRIQIYNGIVFTLDRGGNYFGHGKLGRLHRYVYESEKGEIPKGFDIHHIDEDKSNNHISNLLCLSKSEHTKIHMKYKNKERAKKISKANKGKVRTEEQRKRYSEAKKGKKLSEEHKRSIAKSWDNRSRALSEETKRKMSNSHKGRKYNTKNKEKCNA